MLSSTNLVAQNIYPERIAYPPTDTCQDSTFYIIYNEADESLKQKDWVKSHIELLERQFPIESINQELQLRTAKEYAENLRIHVNHLNKVLKEVTGKTTTEIIASRITQEAKILLKQTDWNISEIANCLGFDEVAHFSNFFKKQTTTSPLHYREN